MRLSRACRPAAGVSCRCRGASRVFSRGRRKATGLGIRARAFVSLWGASYFSLRGQRKVTTAAAGAAANGEAGPQGGGQDARSKREATPRTRPPGILPRGCEGGLRGFSTAHPCAVEKLARIHSGHPADFPSPTRRVRGAPGRAARSCAQKQQPEQSKAAQSRASTRAAPTPSPPSLGLGERVGVRGASALAVAVASGAHDARPLFRGPSEAVRRGREGRAAGEAMDGLAFSTGQEARPKSPATPHVLSVHGRTESASAGWPFSLRRASCPPPCGPAAPFAAAPAAVVVTFSLATQRESSSRPVRGTKRFSSSSSSTNPGTHTR